jgi:hypothetical protein
MYGFMFEVCELTIVTKFENNHKLTTKCQLSFYFNFNGARDLALMRPMDEISKGSRVRTGSFFKFRIYALHKQFKNLMKL